MRILHICTDRNIGGAGIWILNLLKSAERERFESAVLLPAGAALAPLLEKEQIPVIEAPIAEKSLDIGSIPALLRAISDFSPDIVHTHGSLSGRIAARLKGRKVVVTRHWVDLPDSAKKRGLGAKFAGWVNSGLADMFIATAQKAAGNLIQSGVNPDKIRVIPNGTALLSELTETEIAEEKARLGLSGFVIGILARLESVKGHIYLLKAAKRLKEQGRDFHILIAGSGTMEAELKAKTQELGLDREITFLGFVSAPGQFLSILDLQVNASYTETTCLALLEGMRIGLPAIASDGGGNPEVITDEENGLLFPVADAEALARGIGRLMDNKDLLDSLGTRAAERYRENFTAEIFSQRVSSVYTEIYNEKTQRQKAGKRG